jgi:hypothetical protein
MHHSLASMFKTFPHI